MFDVNQLLPEAGEPKPPPSLRPKQCHLKRLPSPNDKYNQYQRCLQHNIDLLFPLFSKNKNITSTFNTMTSIINSEMERLELGAVIPPTTATTLAGMQLLVVSISSGNLRFKVLFPKMEGTPKIGGGKRKSVERSSHSTNITMVGRLALTQGNVVFSNITVQALDSIVFEFAAAQGTAEQTLSMARTTVHEDIGVPMGKNLLQVANIVFQIFQEGVKYLSS
ncbi:hypothetical protein FJT64_016357 [Amphibalanus amphitrite]|uniref:Uncharacterized protein n=1 Tax=Amphibalanus amphitrite TaxID=1232801 RepID=A0A6A4WZU8_AMPAM|nr:hypothetical protein FJT64_016357 [Amphibalanus amphitrite]